MGSGSRVDNQTFYICNVGKKGKNLQMVYECMCFLLNAFDFKGEDGCASIRKILFIEGMVRMFSQRRMIYLLNQRMLGQVFNYLLRVFGMTIQSERQSFNSLQQEESIKGRNCRSCISEKYGADVCYESGRTCCICKGDSVIARV